MAALVFIPNQELIYIASGLRCLAQRAREDAAKQTSLAVKHINIDSAETYERMAERYDELRTDRR